MHWTKLLFIIVAFCFCNTTGKNIGGFESFGNGFLDVENLTAIEGEGRSWLSWGGEDEKEKSAVIYLHGLGDGKSDTRCNIFKSWAMELSSERNYFICPKAPITPHALLPSTWPGIDHSVHSWFNFWMMPSVSVLSPWAGESKEQLDTAFGWVEKLIEILINNAQVKSENIVVAGSSQGGALTIWTALHTKYKLGGFIPMVTWLPLRNTYPITDIQPRPVNWNTPFLHINGLADLIVPYYPAGMKTEEEMKKVFPNYVFKNEFGTHTTTFSRFNIFTIRKIRNWAKKNTNLKFWW